MTFTKLVFFVRTTLLSVASAPGENPWKTWERDLHRQCPANHLEWIADGSYDDFLADFVDMLPLSTQKNIAYCRLFTPMFKGNSRLFLRDVCPSRRIQ